MNSIPQQLLLQLFLILLNAFFAMTEIAVISLSPAKLRKLSEEGDKTAPRLLKLVEEPAGFLSTIQIGITLAGFLGSAFAADNFSEIMVNWIYYDLGFQGISLRILDTLSVIIITVILSYFTLVLGELTPKRIAMQKPMEVARISCGVVSALQGFFRGIGKIRIAMTATFSQIAMRCILSVILVPRYGIYGVCASVGTGWVLMVVYSSYNCIHYFRKKQLTIEEQS